MKNKITKNCCFQILNLLAFILLLACSKKQQSQFIFTPSVSDSATETNNDNLVVTTIAPYQFLLRELAGEHIKILNTSEQLADPHVVDLTPRQVLLLQKTKLFLSINPLEENLLLASLGRRAKIVEMWHGFPLLDSLHFANSPESPDSLGTAKKLHGKTPASWDEHFWLSPAALPLQIETIARSLELLLPEQKQLLATNKRKLLQRNRELTKYLRATLPQLQNGKIMSFHSSLAYFADFFAAEQIAVERQGITLGSDELLHLFADVRELTFPAIVVSPQFAQGEARTLAKQLRLAVVEFDPLYPDIFKSLANLADKFSKLQN